MQEGNPVTYVDTKGRERPALVTAVHGGEPPSVNVVVVHEAGDQRDTYGRKIERFCSVVHEENQYAHGNYWK